MSLDWGSETADHGPLNRTISTWNLKVESWTFAVELGTSCTEIVSPLCEQLNANRDNNTQRKFMPQSVPPLEVNSQLHPLTRSSWSGAGGCVSRSLFCYGLPALLLNSSAQVSLCIILQQRCFANITSNPVHTISPDLLTSTILAIATTTVSTTYTGSFTRLLSFGLTRQLLFCSSSATRFDPLYKSVTRHPYSPIAIKGRISNLMNYLASVLLIATHQLNPIFAVFHNLRSPLSLVETRKPSSHCNPPTRSLCSLLYD